MMVAVGVEEERGGTVFIFFLVFFKVYLTLHLKCVFFFLL